MSFCTEPWATEMPARTKAQRAVRIKRAAEEERVLYKRFAVVSLQADAHWCDYLDAKERRRRLERARA